MDLLFIIAASVVVCIFVLVLLFLKSLNYGESKQTSQATNETQRHLVPRRIVAGGGTRRRQRRGEIREEIDDAREDNNVSDDEVVEERDDDLAALRESGKIGAKKMKKLEEKAERKSQREAAEIERQEKKAREELREEERKRQELRKQKEEEEKEAKEEEIRQEKKKQEEEEYQRLKEGFTVDEEGTDAMEETEAQNLLQEFINHIKKSKVVMLEDLAAKFHIKTQDAIDRVKILQDDGSLTGVIDDRGKFIYITQEEYFAVAKFIKQRGRVSISELSDSINQLVSLSAITEECDLPIEIAA